MVSQSQEEGEGDCTPAKKRENRTRSPERRDVDKPLRTNDGGYFAALQVDSDSEEADGPDPGATADTGHHESTANDGTDVSNPSEEASPVQTVFVRATARALPVSAADRVIDDDDDASEFELDTSTSSSSDASTPPQTQRKSKNGTPPPSSSSSKETSASSSRRNNKGRSKSKTRSDGTRASEAAKKKAAKANPSPTGSSPKSRSAGATTTHAKASGAAASRQRRRRAWTVTQMSTATNFYNQQAKTANGRPYHQCPRCYEKFKGVEKIRQHIINTDTGCVAPPNTYDAYLRKIGGTFHRCDTCGFTSRKKGAQHKCTSARPSPTSRKRKTSRQQRRPQARQPRAAGAGAPQAAPTPDVVFTAPRRSWNVDAMRKILDQVVLQCASHNANPSPRAKNDCRVIFIRVMSEFNKMATARHPLGVRTPISEPHRKLLQTMGAAVMVSLPGLADQYGSGPTNKSAEWMLTLLTRNDANGLMPQVVKHGWAAVILDYFILPHWPHVQLPPEPLVEEPGILEPATDQALRRLVSDGYYSKAMNLARQRVKLQSRGDSPPPRPTLEVIKALVQTKFPGSDERDELPPVHRMPKMNAVSGVVDWANEPAERQRQQDTYGEKPAFLKMEDVALAWPAIKRQASAGVGADTNAFIKRVFGDPTSPDVENTLLPFMNVLLTGSTCVWAMDIFRLTRLALIPKPNQDFRPLGIGSSLYRLVSVCLSKKYGRDVAEHLVPHQYAVAVSDAGTILSTAVQGVFNHGRDKGAEDCDVVLTDIKNAYNTMRRSCIYNGLQRMAPELLRWFMLTHGQSATLVHSRHGVVGYVQTGVKQGDPLASLFFSIGMHESLTKIDAIIRDAHPDSNHAGALAFADDITLVGNADTVLPLLPQCADILRDGPGLSLEVTKTRAVLSRHRTDDDRLLQLLEQQQIKFAGQGDDLSAHGGIIMGIPFGTPQYVETQVAKIVHEHMEDLAGLRYFDRQQQWTLLRACINTRPRYLVRSLPPSMATAVMREFDEAVSRTALSIMHVPKEEIPREVYDNYRKLRGLPLMLSGSPLTHVSRLSERVKHVRKARVLSYQYVTKHLQRLQSVFDDMWQDELVRHRIRATEEDFEPDEDDPNPLTVMLQGHTLGNIPPEAIVAERIPGVPDLASCSAHTLRQRADQDAMVDNLILHTAILNNMRESEEQNRTLFAAQILSQSCPNSGHALQWWPHKGNRIKQGQFTQLLRKRFAIPCLLPLDDEYSCSCGGRTVPATLSTDPFHALHCKAHGKAWRTTDRHNRLAKDLARSLEKVPELDILQVGHPRHESRNNPERAADIKLVHAGVQYMLDVVVTGVATKNKVRNHRTHLKPGAAAHKAYRDKLDKYKNDVSTNYIFVPFAVETGGRIHPDSCAFLDNIAREGPDERRAIQATYRAISRSLMFRQTWMMKKYVEEYHRTRWYDNNP